MESLAVDGIPVLKYPPPCGGHGTHWSFPEDATTSSVECYTLIFSASLNDNKELIQVSKICYHKRCPILVPNKTLALGFLRKI
jgi:hypothetical protein